jgi:6-phosphofructokinase 2
MLVTLLERESIPANVIRVDATTRHDVIVKDCSSGCEYRLVLPGEEMGIEEWQHVLRALRSLSPTPEYVVASGSLPPGVPVDFFARLSSLAREKGFRLAIDSSGEPLRYAAGAGTFLLKPNLSELATLAGMATLSAHNIEEAARSLVHAGHAVAVVVSAGAGGALLVTADFARHIPAPLVSVASRVGAGDSMMAGIVLALARGWDLDDAAQFGVAAGSAAVMIEGHHLCRREETEQLFEWIRGREAARTTVPESVALL